MSHQQPGVPPGYAMQPMPGQPGIPPGYIIQQQPSLYPNLAPDQAAQQPLIDKQPLAEGGGAPHHQSALGSPPGLQYLATLDEVFVRQKVELLEVVTGIETKNKFSIENSLGQRAFFAAEESDLCTRLCCGQIRPFAMRILDNYQNEVIHLERPLKCACCCCPCCLQTMEVFSPPGTLAGVVEQNWTCMRPSLTVKDATGEPRFHIRGPVCPCGCSDIDFIVMDAQEGIERGKITKQWGGFTREAFTDADNFRLTFPPGLDLNMKTLLLGACFLVDVMYFERSGNR